MLEAVVIILKFTEFKFVELAAIVVLALGAIKVVPFLYIPNDVVAAEAAPAFLKTKFAATKTVGVGFEGSDVVNVSLLLDGIVISLPVAARVVVPATFNQVFATIVVVAVALAEKYIRPVIRLP